MYKLRKINEINDIPEKYLNTPISELFEYHNLGKEHNIEYQSAQMLVGMCMDNRKILKIPRKFAFIIRSGGGNLRYSDFKVSFAISIGGIQHIVLLAHNHCGMVGLSKKKDAFVEGLVENGGWGKEYAEVHFEKYVKMFEIDDETEFVVSEARRLRIKYPKVEVVPIYYNIDEDLLYLIEEN